MSLIRDPVKVRNRKTGQVATVGRNSLRRWKRVDWEEVQDASEDEPATPRGHVEQTESASEATESASEANKESKSSAKSTTQKRGS